MPVPLTDWQNERLTDRPTDRPTDRLIAKTICQILRAIHPFQRSPLREPKRISEKKTMIARRANINFFSLIFFFARTSPTDFVEKDRLLAVCVVNVGNPFHQLPLSCGASKAHCRQSNYRFLRRKTRLNL